MQLSFECLEQFLHLAAAHLQYAAGSNNAFTKVRVRMIDPNEGQTPSFKDPKSFLHHHLKVRSYPLFHLDADLVMAMVVTIRLYSTSNIIYFS